MKLFSVSLVFFTILTVVVHGRAPIPPPAGVKVEHPTLPIGPNSKPESDLGTDALVAPTPNKTLDFDGFGSSCCCNCTHRPIPPGRSRFQCKMVCPREPLTLPVPLPVPAPKPIPTAQETASSPAPEIVSSPVRMSPGFPPKTGCNCGGSSTNSNSDALPNGIKRICHCPLMPVAQSLPAMIISTESPATSTQENSVDSNNIEQNAGIPIDPEIYETPEVINDVPIIERPVVIDDAQDIQLSGIIDEVQIVETPEVIEYDAPQVDVEPVDNNVTVDDPEITGNTEDSNASDDSVDPIYSSESVDLVESDL